MNKIYKLVWNTSINAWAVVSEVTASKTKAKKSALATAIAVVGLIAASQNAMAYEAGGGSTFTNCTANSTGSGSSMSSSIAIGSDQTATTPTPNGACAPTQQSIAIGNNASTAKNASSTGNHGQSIAIGNQAWASGDQSIAFGANVRTSGNSGVAIGGDDIDKAIASDGAKYTALTGDVLKAGSGNYTPTTASGAASTALGMQNVASEAFATAIGTRSEASGIASIAMGTRALATDQGAMAIGVVSNASASGATAIGMNTDAQGKNSTAIGSGNTAGGGAQATGDNATAIGSGSSASADATAIGTGAKATLAGGVAIGTDSVSAIDKGVAGYDLITGLASTATDTTWNSSRAAVSVGDVANGVTRQITGVAAGTADTDVVNVAQLKTIKTYADTIANSTADALGGGAQLDSTTGAITAPTYTLGNTTYNNVGDALQAARSVVEAGANMDVVETVGANGEALYTVATKKDVNFDTVTVGNVKLDQATDTMTGLSNKDLSAADFAQAGRAATEEQVQVVQNNVLNTIGGTPVINADGSITYADIGGTGETNVNDAIKKVNTASKAAKTEVVEGDNIEVIESIGADGQSIYTVATARNVNFDSVMVGNVLMSGSSNTITGLSNTDLSASDFAQAGRAATEEQLQAVKDQLQGEQQAANDSAVKYDKNADGSVNKDSVTFEGTPATSNQDASTGKITTTGGSSLNNVASAGDYKDVANANKAVNAGDLNNAILDASKNTADIIGGNTTVNSDGSISNNDIGGTGQSTIDDAIRNVNQAAQAAKTEVVQGDNIVVNKSTGADGQSIYTVSTAKDVKFDSVTADKVQVGNVNITVKGIDAGNTQITGVAAGAVNSSSTDAVNGSQLNASNQQIANALGGGAKMENNVMTAPSYTIGQGDNAQTYNNVGSALDALNKQDQALGNSITNLNQGLRDVNQRIDDVEKKANAGIAAAMAMETAPFIAGKYTYAVGAAYHGGENAVGATLRKTADNGRWSIIGGVAAGSQGAASVRVGFSGIIN